MSVPFVNALAAPPAAYPALAPIPPAKAPVSIAVPRPSVTSFPSERLFRALPAAPLAEPPTAPAPIDTATQAPVSSPFASTAPPAPIPPEITPVAAPIAALVPSSPQLNSSESDTPCWTVFTVPEIPAPSTTPPASIPIGPRNIRPIPAAVTSPLDVPATTRSTVF